MRVRCALHWMNHSAIHPQRVLHHAIFKSRALKRFNTARTDREIDGTPFRKSLLAWIVSALDKAHSPTSACKKHSEQTACESSTNDECATTFDVLHSCGFYDTHADFTACAARHTSWKVL